MLGDDHQVFIWEVDQIRQFQDVQQHRPPPGGHKVIHEPYRAANVGGEANQLSWSSANPDWVAVGFGRTIQALRL
jgi:WD repeat-containing protein 68